MLQLPTPSRQRFARPPIANSAPSKPKTDPLLSLIAKADRILDNVLKFDERVFTAKHKLPEKDRHLGAYTNVPAELLNMWPNGFMFSSEHHIDKQFGRARRNLTAQLLHYRSRQRSQKPGHGAANVETEIKDGIASTQRKLALLKTHLEPLMKMHRREEIRLRRVQNAVGLMKAQRSLRQQRTKLWAITRAIGKSKPTTAAGALALIMYVQRRTFPGCGADFSYDSDTPGNFCVLLRHAHDFLSRSAK